MTTTTIKPGEVLATRDQIKDLFTALFAATDHPERRYGELQKALDEARFAGPEVTITEDEDGDLHAVCPHDGCDSETFYDVDRSERWCELEFNGEDEADLSFSVSSPDNHNETVGWKCAGCDRGVDLSTANMDWD